jgi:hypothetical protein
MVAGGDAVSPGRQTIVVGCTRQTVRFHLPLL